jgi:hypothetical protein
MWMLVVLVVLVSEVDVDVEAEELFSLHCELVTCERWHLKAQERKSANRRQFASRQGCSETKSDWRGSKVQGCRRPSLGPVCRAR